MFQPVAGYVFKAPNEASARLAAVRPIVNGLTATPRFENQQTIMGVNPAD
jgi:hypothetical protein